MARLNPLFGIGGGNLKYVTMDELKSHIESRGEIFDSELFTSTYSHPHNIYLANLVDRGVLGLLSFLCFMIIWFNSIVNSYKKFNKNSKNMLFIMSSFSAWVTIFGIGFVNTTFKHENALLSLFFLGLHLSLLKRKNKLFS